MLEVEESKRKASILVESLPYVRRFRGSIFVIKYGGSFMDSPDPEVRSRVAQDLVLLSFLGIQVVVVHGGGKAVTRVLTEKGIEAQFIDGLRVTDKQSIEVVDEVLNGSVNQEVASFVARYDCDVQRIAGKEILSCTKLPHSSELGYVGEIQSVNTGPILHALDAGSMPIISSTASDQQGQCYNINADTVAGAVAEALQAEKIVYLTDVAGLYEDFDDDKSLIRRATISELQEKIDSGLLSGGMIPKIEACVRAVENGVSSAHLLDGRVPHVSLLELFTDLGIGTMIVP